MFKIQDISFPGPKIIHPHLHGDERGYVAETLTEAMREALGEPSLFIQENFSFSAEASTVRGLHFQNHPHAQAKLICVASGKIFDVAVDLRKGSQSFGQHVGISLAAEEFSLFYIPAGFAHGFCTLAPNTTILYKMTALYAPESEGGLLWNDPDLGIVWPQEASSPILSEKDKKWPRLKDWLAAGGGT
jgi:dTDP-4-dehydrorhamnose 3,5-epimerase